MTALAFTQFRTPAGPAAASTLLALAPTIGRPKAVCDHFVASPLTTMREERP